MPSLKVDEGANELETAEKTQAGQLQNTSCLGQNLGRPPGAECSTSSKKRKRESEDAVGAVGQYEMIRALDRQLLLAGLGGLKAFAPLKERCTILQDGEHRYEVEMPPWEGKEYVSALPPGTPWKRLCVVNVRTNERRFEVSSCRSPRPLPLLCASTDEGGGNMPMVQFMQGDLHLRLLWFRDPSHRYANDWKLALKHADLWPFVLERLHCMNVLHGPWQEQGWWRKIQEGMEKHFKKSNRSNAVFLALVHKIADDKRNLLTAEPGSQAEQQQVWGLIQKSKCLRAVGDKIKLKTWFQFHAALRERDSEFHTFLYFLCVLLHQQGHFVSAADMPIWDVPLAAPLVETLPGDGLASKKTKEGKDGEKLRAMRAKLHNGLSMAAHLQGEWLAARKTRVLIVIGTPVETAYRKDRKYMTSERECVLRYCAYALHGHNYVNHRLWSNFSNLESLQYMGFDMGDGSTADYREYVRRHLSAAAASSGSASPPAHNPERIQFLDRDHDDAIIAECAWNFCRELVKHRACSMSHYTSAPPGQFALLAHTNTAYRQLGLARAMQAWNTLKEAERLAVSQDINDAAAKVSVTRLLARVGWVHHDIPREILARLAQHGFTCVPPPVQSMLQCAFRGWCQSVVNEKGFQSMKDAKRDNPNKKVSRRKRFYQLITKEDFKTFEREEVQYSETLSPGMPRQLCQQSYESRHYKPTLPDTDLRAIMKETRRVGPRLDAQGAHIAVAAWRLLCQAHDEGTWKQLGTAWRALLLPVGSVCRTMSSDSAFLVLRTCEHGALLWPMSRHSGNGLIAFSPSAAQDAACEWKAIWKEEDWRCCFVRVLPPRVSAQLFNGTACALPPGVLVLQEGPERNVIEAAAWDGFASCTTLFLDKLLKSRKLLEDVPKEERPKSIIAKVDMLVTNILPGISDAEKAMIMRKRAGLDRKKKPSLLFMGKHMDHCTGTLDVDDEKGAKKYMTETHCQDVSMQENTLSFIRERKWIT